MSMQRPSYVIQVLRILNDNGFVPKLLTEYEIDLIEKQGSVDEAAISIIDKRVHSWLSRRSQNGGYVRLGSRRRVGSAS